MNVFEFNETEAAQNEKLEKLNNIGINTNTFINRNDLNPYNDESMEYLIHNNGGRPYKVVANRAEMYVFDGERNNYNVDPLIVITKFIGFWSTLKGSTQRGREWIRVNIVTVMEILFLSRYQNVHIYRWDV